MVRFKDTTNDKNTVGQVKHEIESSAKACKALQWHRVGGIVSPE
jgi:hypothetical protein